MSFARGALKNFILLSLLGLRRIRDAARTVRRSHPVRVFTFHRITAAFRDGMTVPPDVFRDQVGYLKATHDVVSLGRALEALQGGERLRRPMAVITFDDGYRSVHREALPVLAAAQVPGCTFVTTDLVGTNRRFPHDAGNPAGDQLEVMSWDEVGELRKAGWTIGAHGATHARWSGCDDAALRREIEGPHSALAERFGPGPLAVAYPFGGPADITPQARALVRSTGYVACFSDFGGDNRSGDDPLALRRIELGGAHATLAWKARVHGIDLSNWVPGRTPPRHQGTDGTPA